MLSRGRFLAEELGPLRDQLGWILLGALFVQTTYLLTGWFTYMGRAAAALIRIFLPWAIGSVIIYSGAIFFSGAFGVTAPMSVAIANSAVGFLLVLLCWGFLASVLRSQKAGPSHV